MSDDKYYSFRDGMPTRPDVDALLKAYPILKVGDFISRTDAAGQLRLEEDSTRFRTVMGAFRSRLEQDFALVLIYDRVRVGFVVASVTDLTDRTGGVLQSIASKARKHRKAINTAASHATEAEKPVAEHHMRLVGTIEREARKGKLNQLPPTAAAETPKIAPPQERKKT